MNPMFLRDVRAGHRGGKRVFQCRDHNQTTEEQFPLPWRAKVPSHASNNGDAFGNAQAVTKDAQDMVTPPSNV
jgi:hypothetical protein